MTRMKISVCILGVLIVASILSCVSINKRCGKLIELLDDVRSFSDQGDTDSAAEALVSFDAEWEEFRSAASVLVSNQKLGEIDRIHSRLSYLLEENSDEFGAEISELMEMIELLKTGEIPYLTSVF